MVHLWIRRKRLHRRHWNIWRWYRSRDILLHWHRADHFRGWSSIRMLWGLRNMAAMRWALTVARWFRVRHRKWFIRRQSRTVMRRFSMNLRRNVTLVWSHTRTIRWLPEPTPMDIWSLRHGSIIWNYVRSMIFSRLWISIWSSAWWQLSQKSQNSMRRS